MEFRAGSFAWLCLLGISRFERVYLELSLREGRLVSLAWDLSPGNFRLGSFTWITFASELSFVRLGLKSFAWELSLRMFRLAIVAGDLSLEMSAWDSSLEHFL